MVIGIIVLIGVIGLIILFISLDGHPSPALLPLCACCAIRLSISEGNYNDVIPDTRQQDEVGYVATISGRNAAGALSVHVGELERSTNRLRKQGDVLSKSYDCTKEAECKDGFPASYDRPDDSSCQ